MTRATMILSVATLTFGSASAYLYQDLSKAREREALLQTRVTALETAVDRQPRATTMSVHTTPPLLDRAVKQPSAPATTNLPQPTTDPALGGFVAVGMGRNPALAWNRSQRLLEDPEYLEAIRQQQRTMMPRMYPDLLNALQLDEEQAQQLFDLLADQQTRAMSIARTAFALPVSTPPDEATMREWRMQQQRLQADRDAEIATLLGDAKAQQWKNYQSTLPARVQVRELRSELDSAGVPLQQDQTERLVAVIASEQQRVIEDSQSSRAVLATPTSDRTALFEQQIQQTQQQQQRMHAAVAVELSPKQLEHYERMQSAQMKMLEVQLKMMRAQAAAEARGDLPPANGVPGSFTLP